METLNWFFTRFKNSFEGEVRQLFTQFTYHLLLWIMPLAVYSLISSIFVAGVIYDLPVGFVDQDRSELSRTIIRDFDAGPHAKLINYDNRLNDATEGLKKAKIYALLYIPPEFESDTLAGKQPTPILYYNALYYSAGLYSTMDYSGLITQLNSSYTSIMASKTGLAVPGLAKLNFIYDGLFNPTGNSRYYQQFSAVVHLLQLLVVTMTIHLLGKMSRRTPVSYPYILGKLAPYTLWYTCLLLFEIAIQVLLSGARVSSNPIYMIFVVFFYVIAAQSMGMLLYTFTRSVMTAYSLIGILVGLALTYSGVMVPEISMPKIAQIISHLEPLTYALSTLFGIFLRHVDFITVLKTCAILLVYPFLVTFIIRRRLVKRLQQKEVLE
ncbi:ABC transporter permease [Utexia brackfieldae]|uniref:ABC transporter permease n=1 Tax=Utexia brackfieldae TaxID=3074108 RepID=UPI00370D9CBC